MALNVHHTPACTHSNRLHLETAPARASHTHPRHCTSHWNWHPSPFLRPETKSQAKPDPESPPAPIICQSQTHGAVSLPAKLSYYLSRRLWIFEPGSGWLAGWLANNGPRHAATATNHRYLILLYSPFSISHGAAGEGRGEMLSPIVVNCTVRTYNQYVPGWP